LHASEFHVGGGGLSIKKRSVELERELIKKALEETGGNKTKASKVLEISHRALLYKIKDYKL
ncbi:MAG: sigma-54-dependent Fis family transcriptional regulator, partial [Proteobacteria bacterium]|nr:sigma-54-dependent Fis family transcriptional regulator [Pseudomonadota bacterium]